MVKLNYLQVHLDRLWAIGLGFNSLKSNSLDHLPLRCTYDMNPNPLMGLVLATYDWFFIVLLMWDWLYCIIRISYVAIETCVHHIYTKCTSDGCNSVLHAFLLRIPNGLNHVSLGGCSSQYKKLLPGSQVCLWWWLHRHYLQSPPCLHQGGVMIGIALNISCRESVSAGGKKDST